MRNHQKKHSQKNVKNTSWYLRRCRCIVDSLLILCQRNTYVSKKNCFLIALALTKLNRGI